MENIYLELTRAFNRRATRAVLSSGQAVVMHKLAVMSKDGDWILKEADDVFEHVLSELDRRGATYRFGAPLDRRWMVGGWSSHFEFRADHLRVRTDFVTRPPRLNPDDLAEMWAEVHARNDEVPVLDVRRLIEIKRTNREKDYVIIGDLARLLADPRAQLRASRSPRDILSIRDAHRDAFDEIAAEREALRSAVDGADALAEALDRERRAQIAANEERLRTYLDATREWGELWSSVSKEMAGMSLRQAHEIMVRRADGVLPCSPTDREPDDA